MKKILYLFFILVLILIICLLFYLNKQKTSISVKPKVAILLDDAGAHLNNMDKISQLNKNITIAFLPYFPNVSRIANRIRKMGFPVILHLPLEPFDKSKMQNQTFLLTDDRYEVLKTKVDLFMDQFFPSVSGCNSHMGSKFTSSTEAMERLALIIKQKNLFFIDSRTSSTSVAYSIMRKNNIPTFQKSLFLDNEDDYEYIKEKLNQGINIATEKNKALLIGHITKENTIDVLINSLLQYNNMVDFIPVTDILE